MMLRKAQGILPVAQVAENIWVKRDDLFVPFPDVGMNGAKTYQCLNLIEQHLDQIKTANDSTVFSDNFLESPQGPIVARVAQHFGLRCIVPVAAASLESALAHRSMQLVQQWGGEVIPVCKMGFALKPKAGQLYGDKYFRVRFGMAGDMASVRKSVVEPVREQAKAFIGIPTADMTLVVAVGSGVAFASLLVGLADHAITFKRIVAIQIAGYDRTQTISRIVHSCGYQLWEEGDFPFMTRKTVQGFEFIEDKTYAYSKHLHREIGKIELDSQYEAKAWDWVVRERLVEQGPVMFYIIGNSNCLR